MSKMLEEYYQLRGDICHECSRYGHS